MSARISKKIIKLERGGFICDTTIGYIQFSSPPETIKDTMKFPKGVPQFYVLPRNFFNWIKGISVAEVEFPIYYNFFLKSRKTYIICSEEQAKRFKNVLEESVFGPKSLELEEDFEILSEDDEIVDLRKEMNFFRRDLKLKDVMSFIIYKDNEVNLKGIKIKLLPSDDFEVTSPDGTTVNIPGKIDYIPKYDIGQRLADAFRPPLFGITCLGPSHGFDPNDNTSGFIIWLNRRGIMVDPPVNSTEWLRESNVNPKHIDSIILTLSCGS